VTTRRNRILSGCCAVAIAVLGPGDAHAAITTTGQVDPADPNLWTMSMSAVVGKSADGTLLVNSGSAVTTRLLRLAHERGIYSEAIFDGSDTTLRTVSTIEVGSAGSGSLIVRNGAIVSNGLDLTIGLGSLAEGVVTVSGEVTSWDTVRQIFVGHYGDGFLKIEDGARVRAPAGIIGLGSSSSGEVTVTGSGSSWSIGSTLIVGQFGAATLRVTDGGLVQVGSPGASHGFGLGLSGEASGVVTLADAGVIRLHGGPIQSPSNTDATFNFNGGRLEGVGTYQVGAGLTQNGGVLAPGNSAGVTTINGFYDLAEGELEIELLGSVGAAGVGFDQLVVNSGVALGASSQLNLLLGYAANVGDSFLIVDSKNANPISGAFANDDELTAEYESLRYSFSLNYSAGTGNDIAVTVASVSLIGDYNTDGFVDAADYTVWRDAVGTSVVAYAGADGNGDGVVDGGDHAVWAAHYGASLAAAMAQAVPEPAAGFLAMLGLLGTGRLTLRSGRLPA